MPTFQRVGQEMEETVGSDNRIVRVYTQSYYSYSNLSFELSVLQVKQALGLTTGMPFADDSNATLRKIKVKRLDTIPPECAWNTDLIFSTEATVPSSDSQDPTQARVKRFKRYREQSKYIFRDINGQLITNSAEVPPEGGFPVTVYPREFVYEWSRNQPTADAFHGSINQNTFNGCAPGTLLCLIESEESYEGAWYFWKETIRMIYDELGWPNPIVDAGLMQLKSEGQLVPCINADQSPATEPQPLYILNVDAVRTRGSMVQIADRPDLCGFIDPDILTPMPFENIGVQQFP